MKQWQLDNWFPIITALVALYAAAIGTLAFVVAWMAERRARRAELAMHTEAVEIARVFAGKVSTPYPELRVEIVNPGHRDVTIRTVRMHRQGDERPMTFFLERGERRLAPGDHAIHARPFQDLGKFTGATPDQVWIAVRSHLRELHRVDGADALPLLEEYFSAKQ